MAYHILRMAGVENPAKRLSKSIRDGENTKNMSHDNFFRIVTVPVLDGKMLDINVLRLFSQDRVVSACAENTINGFSTGIYLSCFTVCLVVLYKEYATNPIQLKLAFLY